VQLEELYDYKNLLMKQLCSDEKIVKLVTNNPNAAVPNHGLPYTQVFPYEFVPETVDDGKTFICFDLDITDVPNKTYYIPTLYVWCFTHKSLLRLDEGGCLLDEMCKSINELLNGSRYYGLGALKLRRLNRFAPITDYLGRVLTYTATDINRDNGGNIRLPGNRKPNRK
jgi:hypothetical protein